MLCGCLGVDRVNSTSSALHPSSTPSLLSFAHICMLNFACLPSTPPPADPPDPGSCTMVLLLSLDSLGQCVSALSKRFVAAESTRDSSVGCPPHCQRDKRPEVRHRKDSLHHQDDAPKLKVLASAPPAGHWLLAPSDQGSVPQMTCSKTPTSILKRPGTTHYGADVEPSQRRKGERRVRFREPETTVHGESARRLRLLAILQSKPAQSVKTKQICSSKRERKRHLETLLVAITGEF